MSATEAQDYASRLTDLARQLNSFAGSLKSVRAGQYKQEWKTIRESLGAYSINLPEEFLNPLFDADDLHWLET